MPKQLGFDQRWRDCHQIQAHEAVCVVRRESSIRCIKLKETRIGNRLGNLFLSRARRSRNQGRNIAHVAVQETLIAKHVVRKDRLPNRSPQSGGSQ